MIVDSYIHIHPMPTADNGVAMPPAYAERTAERLRRIGIDPDGQAKFAIERMDAAGVDVAVVQNPHHDRSLGHIRTNDSVHAAIEAYPGRLYAFAGIDILPAPDVAELERAVTKLGMKGVRLLPSTQYFAANDFDLMAPLYEALIDLKLPLFAQAGPTFLRPDVWKCDLRTWYDVARRYPELRLVMAHLGHGAIGDLDMAAQVTNATPNGYIDAAAMVWFCALEHMPVRRGVSPSDVFLHEILFPETPDGQRTPEMEAVWQRTLDDHARLLRRVANMCPGKLIYGTDIPFIARFDFIDHYRRAFANDPILEDILGGTMARLINL